MRGRIKIWTLTLLVLLFSASLMLSTPSVKAQGLIFDWTVSLVDPVDGDTTFGPYNPGNTFTVNVEAGWVEGVRAVELTVHWDPTVLELIDKEDPLDARVLGRNIAGPFLTSGGVLVDDAVAKKSVAGDKVTFNNMITTKDWVDGDSLSFGPMAIMHFSVVGGGKTNLELSGKLMDKNFNLIRVPTIPPSDVAWVGGFYWGPYPHIAFTWWVPIGHNTTFETALVHGITKEGVSYDMQRPILTPQTTQVELVEGGTMFYGDQIIFDASASYDLKAGPDGNPIESPIDPSKFKWVMREGGEDVLMYTQVIPIGAMGEGKGWGSGKAIRIKRGPFVTRFESGGYDPGTLPSWGSKSEVKANLVNNTLDYGPVISWIPPFRRRVYAAALGWTDLTLKVTDSDGNTATFFTWIRIYRLSPGKTASDNLPDPNHSLSKDGYTMSFGGKIQNRGGTGTWPYGTLAVYLELNRMIHGYFWGRVRFLILDSTGKKPVGAVFTPSIWLGPTEIEVNRLYGTWTMPEGIKPGPYFYETQAFYDASGFAYGTGSGRTVGLLNGIAAAGVILGDFNLLP